MGCRTDFADRSVALPEQLARFPGGPRLTASWTEAQRFEILRARSEAARKRGFVVGANGLRSFNQHVVAKGER